MCTTNLEKKLYVRQQMGNLRNLYVKPSLIDFSSNDYLGLARSSLLAKNVCKEYKSQSSPLNGLGSTGSRLLTGNSAYAQKLEENIAKFHGYKAGTLFNCGYMANVGLFSALTNANDTIIFDAAIHASARDGVRLSAAKALPFRHNDLNHLELRLKNSDRRGDVFICIESIYSTDGSCAPLREICALTQKHKANLIIDEAHSVGIYGPQGRGLVAKYNLTEQIFAQIVTFGKAVGVFGAIVLGDALIKQALVNFATSYIYTTALPLHMLATIQCSYDLFCNMQKERAHIHNLIKVFQHYYIGLSHTHIQFIPIKGNRKIKSIEKKLEQQGVDVRALLSPTVRRGHELLRICLHAFNTTDELQNLLQLIQFYENSTDA